MQWVHCQNTDCDFYDARYTAKMRQEKMSASFYDSVENLILLRGETIEPDDD